MVFANGTVSRFRAQRPEGDDASTAPAPSGAPADLAPEAAVAVLPTGAIEASVVGEDSTEIILGGGGGGEDSVLTPSPPSRPRSVSRRRTTPTRESSR